MMGVIPRLLKLARDNVIISLALISVILITLLRKAGRGVRLALVAAALILQLVSYVTLLQKSMRIWVGCRAKDDLLSSFASQLRPPKPPVWCFSAWLQFVPWILMNGLHEHVLPLSYQRIKLKIRDRTTNDDSLSDEMALSFFPPLEDPELCEEAPLILIMPGLC